MSCKVVAQPGEPPQKLRWKDLGTGAEKPGALMPARSPEAPNENGEIHKLHSRIVELEKVLESEVQQARDRAFKEGEKAGRETAAAEIQPVMERMLRSISDIAGLRARIRRETETDIVTLTVAIARRVLRRELSVDPEAIHGVVKAALEKVQLKEICAIRAHPDHVAVIRSFFEKSGLGAGLEIAADATMPLGGVVMETKRGNLDASVETQLKEIERGFTDRLGN
jgi:flagellar assembly protein FliH